jgi:predicted CopG family antitoxin
MSEINSMKTITLEVSDPVAERLNKMSAKEKNALTEAITRLVTNRKSLEEIMHEASEQARKNGLTPEILEELLKDK